MSTLLYRHGASWLHRSHPLDKLCFLVWAVVAAFSVPWRIALPVSAVMVLVGTVCAGRTLVRFWLATIAPLAIALLILHGALLHSADLVLWGVPRLSRAGLESAAAVLGRISFLLAASLLVLITTHPAHLLKALDAKGFPSGISYLIASPLLLADRFTAKLQAIRDAQRARGLNIESSPWKRFRSLPALLLPLVTQGLEEAHHRSATLTGRAFRVLPRRTVLDPPQESRLGRLARWVFLGAAGLQGGWALWH